MLTDTFYNPPALGKYHCSLRVTLQPLWNSCYMKQHFLTHHFTWSMSVSQEGGNDGVRLSGATSKTPDLKWHGLTYMCLSLTSHAHAQTWNTVRVQKRWDVVWEYLHHGRLKNCTAPNDCLLNLYEYWRYRGSKSNIPTDVCGISRQVNNNGLEVDALLLSFSFSIPESDFFL